MARAELLGDRAVILRALIHIVDHQPDRRAGGHALEHAGQDANLVWLLALRREFRLAGATAVEVGTANFWDPRACERLVEQLERWCLEQHIESVAELRGGMIKG